MTTVEIPPGSGNRYRYEYENGKTVYKGPVGEAPALKEAEFMESLQDILEERIKPAQEELARVRKRDERATYVDSWERTGETTEGGGRAKKRVTERKKMASGKPIYLGAKGQVKDIDPEGLSHTDEVKKILEQIDQDRRKGINMATLQSRTMTLGAAIKQSGRGEFATKAKQQQAIRMVNKYRGKLGWDPIDVEISDRPTSAQVKQAKKNIKEAHKLPRSKKQIRAAKRNLKTARQAKKAKAKAKKSGINSKRMFDGKEYRVIAIMKERSGGDAIRDAWREAGYFVRMQKRAQGWVVWARQSDS